MTDPERSTRGAEPMTTLPGEDPARMAHVALIVDSLTGSYNAEGVQRWFARPQRSSGDRRRRICSAGTGRRGDEAPVRVLELALTVGE
jgi:hypothetical protein